MKKIPAATFKAECLQVMKQVQATGEAVTVTKRGKPLVKVVPIATNDDVFGFMKGEFQIVGDIESPAVPAKRWKVTQE